MPVNRQYNFPIPCIGCSKKDYSCEYWRYIIGLKEPTYPIRRKLDELKIRCDDFEPDDPGLRPSERRAA